MWNQLSRRALASLGHGRRGRPQRCGGYHEGRGVTVTVTAMVTVTAQRPGPGPGRGPVTVTVMMVGPRVSAIGHLRLRLNSVPEI